MAGKQIRMIGGPETGKVFTVSKLDEVFHVVSSERINITELGSLIPQYATTLTRSTYRIRRIASTGHPVHNTQQEVLYDFDQAEVFTS